MYYSHVDLNIVFDNNDEQSDDLIFHVGFCLSSSSEFTLFEMYLYT